MVEVFANCNVESHTYVRTYVRIMYVTTSKRKFVRKRCADEERTFDYVMTLDSSLASDETKTTCKTLYIDNARLSCVFYVRTYVRICRYVRTYTFCVNHVGVIDVT